MYRDDEQGKRKTYRDNCNSYNIATIRHIHQSHKVYYCFKIISIAKVRLFSHQSDKLYDVSTQFISSQPNQPPRIRVEGRGGEEGWVATEGLHFPCQEKGVRPLALDSKSWISSLQKVNKNMNWQEFFLYFLMLCKPLIVSNVCITFLNSPTFPMCLDEDI